MKKSKRLAIILTVAILIIGIGSGLIYAKIGGFKKHKKEPQAAKEIYIEPSAIKAEFAKARLAKKTQNRYQPKAKKSSTTIKNKTSKPQPSKKVAADDPNLVATIPYGDGQDQVGLKWTGLPDNMAYGPENFTIGKDAIFILDKLNKRIQVYDLQGKYLRTTSFVPDVSARNVNFVVDGDGYLYLRINEELISYSPDGKEITRHKADQDENFFNYIVGKSLYSSDLIDKISYPVETVNKGTTAKVQNGSNNKRIGKVTKSGSSWKVHKKSSDHAQLLKFNDKNELLKTIDYSIDGLLEFVFVNEDSTGKLYIEIGRDVSSNKVVAETLILDSSGKEITKIPKKFPICWMSKNIEVTDDGTIWQVVPLEDGLKIYRWKN